MKIGRRPRRTVLALACATLLAPASAQAAQHVVDDDKLECPSAGFTSISAAVAAAAAGDTISVCDGTYYEGAGGAGTSSLTIDKALTIKGAGANKVFVGPSGDIAAATPNLRDAAGSIIAVTAGRTNISGVTIFGANRNVEAGVTYLNADGAVSSVEIVDIVRSGMYTGTSGAGFVVLGNEADRLRNVELQDSIIDGYDAAGVILDATLANGGLRANSTFGVNGLVTGNRITGAGGGGGISGQDGLRVTNRAVAVAIENHITDNSDAGVDVLNSTNSSQQRFNRNNIQRNRIGMRHEAIWGTCGPTTGQPGLPNRYRLDALENWWGSPMGPSTDDVIGRGDAVSGDSTVNAGCAAPPTNPGQTDRVDFRGFLGRPAPIDAQLNLFRDSQPTVSITAPAAGADLDDGEPLAITANAADDIGVHSVKFYRGDTRARRRQDRAVHGVLDARGRRRRGRPSRSPRSPPTRRGQTGADAVAVGGEDDAAPFVELLRPTKEATAGSCTRSPTTTASSTG